MALIETGQFIMLDSFRNKIRKIFLLVVDRWRELRALQKFDDFICMGIGLRDALRMIPQPKIALLRSSPTPAQVVANYTRGLWLCGQSFAFVPLTWRSFPTRSIITPETAKIPRDVRRTMRRSDLKVKFNEDFEDIIHACREGRDNWQWITPQLIDVYREVHKLGFVATVGVYRDDNLIAGLWGISVGRTFGIMSAFHRENGAGSLAIGTLVETLTNNGPWSLLDNMLINANYMRFGAFEVPTDQFCELVWQTLR